MDVLIPTHWSGGDTAPLAPRFNKIVPTKIHHFQGHSCEKSAAFSDSSTSGGDSWWCSKKMGPGKLQDCHPLDATWGNHRIGLAMGKCKMCVRVSKYIGSMYAQWNPQNYHKWMEQQKTSTTMYHLVSFFQSFETETFNSWHLSLGYSMMLKSFVMWIIGWFMKFYIYKWQSASCCWYWTQSEAVTLQVPIFCRNKSLFVIDFFFFGGGRATVTNIACWYKWNIFTNLYLYRIHIFVFQCAVCPTGFHQANWGALSVAVVHQETTDGGLFSTWGKYGKSCTK